MPIVLLATCTVRADSVDAYEGVIARLAPQVRATEPGVRPYQLARSKEYPLVCQMWETYEDQTAVDAHRRTAHLLAEMDNVMACQLTSPVIETFAPVTVPW